MPGMQPIRVLLANQHPIVRNNLRSLIERDSGLHVIAEAANGREAVVLADYKHPDVILLDMKLPLLNGILAAREISSKNQKQGIVFVSVDTDDEYIQEAFKAGARGYVRSDSAQSDLVRAIRLVAEGGTFLSPGISATIGA